MKALKLQNSKVVKKNKKHFVPLPESKMITGISLKIFRYVYLFRNIFICPLKVTKKNSYRS